MIVQSDPDIFLPNMLGTMTDLYSVDFDLWDKHYTKFDLLLVGLFQSHILCSQVLFDLDNNLLHMACMQCQKIDLHFDIDQQDSLRKWMSVHCLDQQ